MRRTVNSAVPDCRCTVTVTVTVVPMVSYLSHERNPVFASVMVNAEPRHSSCPVEDEPCADSSAGETILNMILTRPKGEHQQSLRVIRSSESRMWSVVWKYSNK